MMSFLRNISQRFAVFMSGRNGFDQLGLACIVCSLVLQIAASLTGMGLLALLSLGAYGYSIFRIFSRKSYKRQQENERFAVWWANIKTKTVQFWKRLKLMRQYKYFKCPQCKALLRMSRGAGEKEICCPKCQNRFRMKA
ncbi:MAG: hypothetical protein IJQ62_08530 [Clostridia bacterium]|nr:hypothetical protein [Clostridia bacterium]